MSRALGVTTSDQPATPSHASSAGQVVAFGTRHGKEHQVAQAFAAVLRAEVVTPPGLDTDQFGTFSGETSRTLSPVDAARATPAGRCRAASPSEAQHFLNRSDLSRPGHHRPSRHR